MLSGLQLVAAEVVPLWKGDPPGVQLDVGPEVDLTKPTDRLIAGRKIIKLQNVARPELHYFPAPQASATGACVVVCPGGGFNILAWDLEGTEVAEWFNSIGVSAAVLKYRVPTGNLDPRWQAPVQDAQRAISLVRHRAQQWNLNRDQIGILGFSAGGHTATRASLMSRQYTAADEVDEESARPDATMLIYPAWLVDDDGTLLEDIAVNSEAPNMFIVHAFDDRVSPISSLALMTALKKHNVPSELHVFESGGHGYGLRAVPGQPVTRWPALCEDWLRSLEWLETQR